jgi:hypothetical protein
VKKRRLVNGTALVFRKPGEESDSESDDGQDSGPTPELAQNTVSAEISRTLEVAEEAKIVIHEDD